MNWKWFLSLFLVTTSLFLGGFVAYIMSSGNRQPQPSIISTTTETPVETLDILIVGDIMLSRNVARHAEKSGKPNWIWEHIASFLRSHDIVIGNLEGPTNGTEVYSYQKVMNFNALPHLIQELPGIGFTALSLANNHILDQGEVGLLTTKKLLETLGMIPFGVGDTKEDAWTPKIIEKNGIKIALIGASYAAYNDDGAEKNEKVARMQDLEQLKQSIANARKISDFTLVMMHGGAEYTYEPTKLQKDFAHTAIDAGADIVFGSHPHWIQGSESYKGKYIFYSLGNFVFDQDFSEETKTGLTVQISLSKKDSSTSVDKLQLSPIVIENYGQPRLLDEKEKEKVLNDKNIFGQINN